LLDVPASAPHTRTAPLRVAAARTHLPGPNGPRPLNRRDFIMARGWPGRLLPLLLLLCRSSPAHGFAVYSPTAPLANVTAIGDVALAGVYRWPARPLRYAIAPDLCEAMQPAFSEGASWTHWLPFPEANFSRCERLEAVVRRAFDTWRAANPALHFVDVSERCAAERLWRPIDERHCVLSPWCVAAENQTGPNYVNWVEEPTPLEATNPRADTCSHRTCWDCARADVVVGAFSQKRRLLGDQHARARVVRNGMVQMRPASADGTPKPGGSLDSSRGRSFLQFNADHVYMDNGTEVAKCWKLENDVCDWLTARAQAVRVRPQPPDAPPRCARHADAHVEARAVPTRHTPPTHAAHAAHASLALGGRTCGARRR
jgi:hypothetical protein